MEKRQPTTMQPVIDLHGRAIRSRFCGSVATAFNASPKKVIAGRLAGCVRRPQIASRRPSSRGLPVIVFRKGLQFIMQILREHVSRTIVIGNLPDLSRLPRFRNQPSPHVTGQRIQVYNAVIEKESRDAGASVFDLFGQALHDDLVFHSDGFHPNDAGHREIATLFLNAIRRKIHASMSFEFTATPLRQFPDYYQYISDGKK